MREGTMAASKTTMQTTWKELEDALRDCKDTTSMYRTLQKRLPDAGLCNKSNMKRLLRSSPLDCLFQPTDTLREVLNPNQNNQKQVDNEKFLQIIQIQVVLRVALYMHCRAPYENALWKTYPKRVRKNYTPTTMVLHDMTRLLQLAALKTPIRDFLAQCVPETIYKQQLELGKLWKSFELSNPYQASQSSNAAAPSVPKRKRKRSTKRHSTSQNKENSMATRDTQLASGSMERNQPTSTKKNQHPFDELMVVRRKSLTAPLKKHNKLLGTSSSRYVGSHFNSWGQTSMQIPLSSTKRPSLTKLQRTTGTSGKATKTTLPPTASSTSMPPPPPKQGCLVHETPAKAPPPLKPQSIVNETPAKAPLLQSRSIVAEAIQSLQRQQSRASSRVK